MIRKIASVSFVAAFIGFVASVQAGSGIFGSGIELSLNGSVILYSLNTGGGTRLTPVGSTATLDQTSWAHGTEASPILNLGSFDPALGQTLLFKGGSELTFKNSGDNVTGAFLDYRIFSGSPSGSFTEISLPFNENNVNGTTGDQRWALESLSTNLLTGLAPGTYTLGVFLRQTSFPGSDSFDNQTGANYGATFTVVPEISPAWMFGAPAIIGALLFSRRRRAKA